MPHTEHSFFISRLFRFCGSNSSKKNRRESCESRERSKSAKSASLNTPREICEIREICEPFKTPRKTQREICEPFKTPRKTQREICEPFKTCENPRAKSTRWKQPPTKLVHRRLSYKLAATYSPTLACSTIGAHGLNCSVRNGKRCAPWL